MKNLSILIAAVVLLAIAGGFALYNRIGGEEEVVFEEGVSVPVPAGNEPVAPEEEKQEVAPVTPPSTPSGSGGTTPPPPVENLPAPEPEPKEPAPATPVSVTVSYGPVGFSPAVIRIKQGTEVIFKNDSTSNVWPASDAHPSHGEYPVGGGCFASAFDACRGISPGGLWSFRFDVVGSWDYHNHLSAGKTGTVIVE